MSEPHSDLFTTRGDELAVASPPRHHAELPLDITSHEWQWAEALIRDVEEEERKGAFVAVFFSWKMALRQFRRMEAKTFADREPAVKELDHHCACVTALISIGKFLQLELAKPTSPDLKACGISDGEIEAQLYELKCSYEEWHSDVNKAKIKDLANLIFRGAA